MWDLFTRSQRANEIWLGATNPKGASGQTMLAENKSADPTDGQCDGNEDCAILQRMLRYEFSEDDLAHLECRYDVALGAIASMDQQQLSGVYLAHTR